MRIMLNFYVILFLVYGMLGLVFNVKLNFSSALNMGILIIAIMLFTVQKNHIKMGRIFFMALLFILLSYNFSLMPNIKNYINTLGFIIISVITANAMESIKVSDGIRLMNLIRINLFFTTTIILILYFYQLILTPESIIHLKNLNFDAYFDELFYIPYGAIESTFGNFYVFLVIFLAVIPKSNKLSKIYFFCAAIVLMPLALSHRTIVLAAILYFILRYFVCNYKLNVDKRIFLVILLITIFIISIDYITDFDRLAGINVSVDILKNNFFGLGMGGYENYVKENSDNLLIEFGNELQIKSGAFWTSPESDFIYFIASLGVLGIFLYVFLMFTLLKIIKFISTNYSITVFDKFILYYLTYLLLSGITSYKSNWYIWWLIIGMGYGILKRLNNQKI